MRPSRYYCGEQQQLLQVPAWSLAGMQSCALRNGHGQVALSLIPILRRNFNWVENEVYEKMT
jgi:hypothetical protein